MNKRDRIVGLVTALAALAIVGILTGCSVEYGADRFGAEPPVYGPLVPDSGLPIVGPDNYPALPAIQLCLADSVGKAASQ